MSLVRRLARPMLAAMFVASGIETLRDVPRRAVAAEPTVRRIADALQIPGDTEQLVRAHAIAQVGGGLLLASGRAPRLASAVLATTVIPTTVVRYPFWTEQDPERRREQQVHALQNIGLLGGLLLAAVDTEGRPSVGWWARRAARRTRQRAAQARQQLDAAREALEDRVGQVTHSVADRLPGH